MRVNKSRKNHAPGNINLFCPLCVFARLHAGASVSGDDEAIAKQHGSVFDDSESGKKCASAWTSGAQCQELRSTCDQ